QFVVEQSEGHRDPTHHAQFTYAAPIQLCHDLCDIAPHVPFDEKWLTAWQQMNRIAKSHLQRESEHDITEGEAARALLEVISNGSGLFVVNSIAIRDIDTIFLSTSKRITVIASRGA